MLVVAAMAAGPIMSRVEQPEYQVAAAEGPFEVRDYGPMIAAEVQVRGERRNAIREGFRLLAAYIFGANRASAKVEMIAPVHQQSQQKIAMTAPVTQKAEKGAWSVRFIMPRARLIARRAG